MSDATRRAIRTLMQFVVGGGLGTLVSELAAKTADPLVKAAIVVGAAFVVSYAQNWLEDNTAFPALLKAPASEGENPIPEG